MAPLVPGTGVGNLAGLPGLVPGPVPGPVGPSRSGRVPPEPSVVVSPFWALPERSLNLFLGWKSSLSSLLLFGLDGVVRENIIISP